MSLERDTLHELLEAAPDAIVVVTSKGVITRANELAERMFGYGPGELVDRPVEALVPARYQRDHVGHRSSYVDEPRKRPMGAGRELTGQRKDGSEFPVEISLSPLETEQGQLVISIIRDVTDRRKAEELQASERELKERLRIRDDFLAIAGHELRTPLAALLMQVQGLQRLASAQGLPARVQERLEKASGAGVRLEKLVGELLDVSRVTAGRLNLEPEALELGELAQTVVDRFSDQAARAQSLISVEVRAKVTGWWDRARLDQVLTNLLSNAIKYGKGKPVEVLVFAETEEAVLQVRDHGIGIEPAQQRRIFERFERAVEAREYGGFGLGLWIARQIVEASGGKVEVESAPELGATFTVRLPLKPSAVPTGGGSPS